VLLSTVAAVLLNNARSERREVATEAALVEARFLADAGLNRAILSLTDSQDPERWQLDGSPRTVKLFDRDLEVQVESEPGKIDIKFASAEMLPLDTRLRALGET
jgi:hypothetical protein